MPIDSEERKTGPRLGDVCKIKRADNARNQSTRLSQGNQETCNNFLDGKTAEQKKLLLKLKDIAKTNPQNA